MSMGWLTESAAQPKQAKPIDIDSSSIVDLKAVLFQRETEVRQSISLSVAPDGASARFKAARRSTGKPVKSDSLGKSNTGVEDRALRDQLLSQAQEKAAQQALHRKAQIYEQLTKGAVTDEKTKGFFLVDFQQKGWTLEDEIKEAEARKLSKGKQALLTGKPQDKDEVVLGETERKVLERRQAEQSELQRQQQNAYTVGLQITEPNQEGEVAGFATMDALMQRMIQERKEWEKKAMQEIMEDRLASERAAAAPDTNIRQKWEQTLSAEEKLILQEVVKETKDQREKHEQLQEKRKLDLDKRREMIAATRSRKRQRLALYQADK